MSIILGEVDINSKNGKTTIMCEGTSFTGGLRCIEFDVPIDQINITVHLNGIKNCQCSNSILLAGKEALYCFSKK